MKFIKLFACIVGVVFLAGCATGLNAVQKREYAAMEQDGVLVKEKDPATGAILGILPGGGSFYARSPGLGVVNLLLWPLSVLWDPVSGYGGSQAINYDATKYNLKRDEEKAIDELNTRLSIGEIDVTTYTLEKSKIAKKYNY